jgi:hypothetical protein
MAPVCVTHLCDILCELPEPRGAKGATVYGKPQHCKRGHFVWETVANHDIHMPLRLPSGRWPKFSESEMLGSGGGGHGGHRRRGGPIGGNGEEWLTEAAALWWWVMGRSSNSQQNLN